MLTDLEGTLMVQKTQDLNCQDLEIFNDSNLPTVLGGFDSKQFGCLAVGSCFAIVLPRITAHKKETLIAEEKL